jgi:hypothetical protein
MAKGDPLPAADHVLRYIKPTHVDRQTSPHSISISGTHFFSIGDAEVPTTPTSRDFEIRMQGAFSWAEPWVAVDAFC